MNPIFDQRIGTKSYFFGSRNCQNFGFGQILAFPNKSFWCFGKISLGRTLLALTLSERCVGDVMVDELSPLHEHEGEIGTGTV